MGEKKPCLGFIEWEYTTCIKIYAEVGDLYMLLLWEIL
jgi:hypothetical protein